MWSCRAPHVPVNLRLTSRDSWAPHERKESGVASPSSSEMGDGRPSASAPTVVDALRSKGQLQSSRLPRFEMGQTSSRPSARSRDPAPRQDWRGLAGSSTFHPASARRLCARINPSRRKGTLRVRQLAPKCQSPHLNNTPPRTPSQGEPRQSLTSLRPLAHPGWARGLRGFRRQAGGGGASYTRAAAASLNRSVQE